MPFQKTRKFVSGLVAFFFLISDLARANPTVDGIRLGSIPESPLSLPAELGSIRETFLPQSNPAAPFLIHLETAHAHYESALKIEEIIRYLERRYRIRLLFAEGASEPLHPEFLKFFQDSRSNQKMLEELAQKGELTGVDLALSPRLKAVGVEQGRLYRSAYQSFKKVLENREASETFLKKEWLKLDQAASKVFPKELRSLIETWQKYNSDQRELLATVRFLAKRSKETAVDLDDPFSQFEWPQLRRLVLLEKFEKEIHPEKFKQERERLSRWLEEKKLSKKFLDVIANPAEKGEAPRPAFERFLEESFPRGFRFADYPEVTSLAASQILKSELEAPALAREIDRLFDRLFNAAARSEEERELLQKYKTHLLLQKLLRLELTREA